jgi:integrase
MAGMTAPFVPDVPVPVVSDNWLRDLLATCDANTFIDRRDLAIIHLFISTPCRRSEIANLEIADVNIPGRQIQILRKGRRHGVVPFGPTAAQALDRYLRSRKKHRWAPLPRLWIAQKGAMTSNGLAQVLERRCQMAGLPKLHLHQFRHTFAHEWLRGGGSEGDLMTLAGWTSRAMLKRYGSMLADERAHEAYRQRSPGDRL